MNRKKMWQWSWGHERKPELGEHETFSFICCLIQMTTKRCMKSVPSMGVRPVRSKVGVYLPESKDSHPILYPKALTIHVLSRTICLVMFHVLSAILSCCAECHLPKTATKMKKTQQAETTQQANSATIHNQHRIAITMHKYQTHTLRSIAPAREAHP